MYMYTCDRQPGRHVRRCEDGLPGWRRALQRVQSGPGLIEQLIDDISSMYDTRNANYSIIRST